MWKLKKSSWILFFGIMAISCLDQPDCFRLNSDQIGVSFKVLGTNKADVTILSGLDIAGFRDILEADVSLSSFLIPLNYLANQTDVTITSNKTSGRMLLKYLSQAQFVSDECGPRYILSELLIDQKSGFDSVRLVTNEVSNPPNINIEIYRCPTTNLVKFDFYQLYIATNGSRSSQTLTLNIDKITTDYSSDLFYPATPTSTVILPVNIDAAEGMFSSNFNLSYDNKTETALLTYALKRESRYNVCDSTMYVSGLKITSPDFDSVSIAVVDKKVMNAPQDPATTNVLIFKCPETNLMKVYFKTLKVGDTFIPANVTFNKITTNFSSDKFYEDKPISTVELPINPLASAAEYYFDFKVKEGDPVSIDTLRVSYDAINKTIFNACGVHGVQKVYTNLKVLPSDLIFPAIPVPKDSLQFPSITNIEILKN